MALWCRAAITVVAITGAALPLTATPHPTQNGLYAAEQAERGAALYESHCESCHGEVTAFVPEVAALLGDHMFRNRWQGRALGELFDVILVQMPQDDPGSLTPAETADLVAHILSGNRLAAGELPLSATPEQLTHPLFEP